MSENYVWLSAEVKKRPLDKAEFLVRLSKDCMGLLPPSSENATLASDTLLLFKIGSAAFEADDEFTMKLEKQWYEWRRYIHRCNPALINRLNLSAKRDLDDFTGDEQARIIKMLQDLKTAQVANIALFVLSHAAAIRFLKGLFFGVIARITAFLQRPQALGAVCSVIRGPVRVAGGFGSLGIHNACEDKYTRSLIHLLSKRLVQRPFSPPPSA